MKNTKKSAFTIVELVIVIAVIAILSAVLIPTFGGIIKNANIATDQTAAASLTSELHIFLKGKQITTEEELMKALGPKYDGGSGIGEKLVPTAGAYGQHFWFDMENQMIISATYGEILLRGEETSSIESGKQLMSLGRGVSNINVSFREIAKEGYFFIDSKGSTIAELLNNIDAMENADDYNAVISSLTTIEATVATEDLEFVRLLSGVVNSTAIVTENYATAPAGASKIYFAAGIKNIKAGGSLANLASGTIVLPSTVQMVATSALVFGGTGENVTLVTSLKDSKDILAVFANGSTNAIIKTGAGDYKIRNTDGTFSETADQIVDLEGNATGDVAESKLPYADFELLFKDVYENNSIAPITDGDVRNAYINYGYFAGTGRTFQIWLRPDEGADVPATNELITWTCNNDKVQVSETGLVTISADVDTTSAPVVITATATGLGGNKIESSVNVYMDVLEYASVKFGTESYNIYSNDERTFSWGYTDNPSYTVSVESAHYTYGKATLKDNSTLEMSADESLLTINGGELNLVFNGASPVANNQTVPVTLTIGGSITATINVEVKDNRDTVFTHALRWNSAVADNNGAFRRYYVGNEGAINLSDILSYETFEACTLTVYGFRYDGASYRPIDHEAYDDEKYNVSATITGTTEPKLEITSAETWNNTKITFGGRCPSPSDEGIDAFKPIIVEVKPADTTKAPTLIELVIVDAVNILSDDSAALANVLNGDTANNIPAKSVVLFSNITVADSETGNTKFEVGEKELYGNGHVISAPKYTARTIDAVKQVDEYLINLTEGGLIENIYLDGPVYPRYTQFNSAQMIAESNRPALYTHYVSGIKMSGNCTLSNSFASGFRQPVQVNGDSTTETVLDNVTLDGGVICNLSIMSGDVLLNNVTTVQTLRKNVYFGTKRQTIGVGVLAETSAKDSVITISGNLMQYNWINKTASGGLFKAYIYDYNTDIGNLAGNIFESAVASYISDIMKTGSDSDQYFNAGITYMLGEYTTEPKLTTDSIGGEIKFVNSNISTLYPKQASLAQVKKVAEDHLSSTVSGVVTAMFNKFNIVGKLYTYGETLSYDDLPVKPCDSFADSNNYYVDYLSE